MRLEAAELAVGNVCGRDSASVFEAAEMENGEKWRAANRLRLGLEGEARRMYNGVGTLPGRGDKDEEFAAVFEAAEMENGEKWRFTNRLRLGIEGEARRM